MKTSPTCRFLRCLLPVLCTVATLPPVAAQQDNNDFFTVSGTVRDSQTGRPVSNVSVMVPNTRIGTVSNADGSFSIKIRYDSGARDIEFSHLGHALRRVRVAGSDQIGITVSLVRSEILIREVTVTNENARLLVDEAVRRIGSNYSDRTSLLTGFYRETVQKRNNYIDVAEAVVEIYRTSYSDEIRNDRLRIVKGRRLVSPRAGDTLAVKLQGGPSIYLQGDIVGRPEVLLDGRELDNYRFSVEESVIIDDRPHYTIAFEPQVLYSDYALFVGRLYIDRESFTISRAEYALDMSNRSKVTAMILRQKPSSLRFNPQEVSHVLSYRQRDGRSYLYYIGFSIRFRCDWRRRLFATNYTVSSETVITDGREDGVELFPLRESFHSDQALGDRVDDFYGPEFWEDYNIIAPTESLENAVDRLKRRME